MPEQPDPKPRPHPRHRPPRAVARGSAPGVAYAELAVTTNFTFLTGASHPEEHVERAARLGHAAIAITDRMSLAGVVRAHVAAQEWGIPLAVGTRLVLATDAGRAVTVLVYPTCRAAYARLCRLLTVGKRRARKGECHLVLHDLLDHEEGLLAVVMPPAVLDRTFLETLAGLRRTFDDDRLSLAAARPFGADDAARLDALARLAQHERVPLVAVNDVHAHSPRRRAIQDVLTCIRHGCAVGDAGFRIAANAERHLKPPEEMARIFGRHRGAVSRSVDVALRASAFRLDEIAYEYPDEICPTGRSAMEHLRDLAEAGARDRYSRGVPAKVRATLDHEYALIDELSYAPYFLTVHDLVRFARSRGILCQGRGAAANSAVCYCLGVTSVDPARIDLLFERFISKERDEPPDIDVDFEHERREEVIQYIYGKYGRERAALTAEVITYRGRSAVRDAGKALGYSLDVVDRLARNIDWWRNGPGDPAALRDIGLDPSDPGLRRLLAIATALMGFPRHLSQHVGGFVITRAPLCELVPIENAAMPDRTVIEWDKDDIDAMGMLKVDVLGLGMLTCIRKAFTLVNETEPIDEPLALHTVPPEDERVYDMICRADTVGVFQIESRAQMTMLPRLRPRCFYDLVIEVAIVRPGPIQGDMVHPYLRRRNGEEPVSYPNEDVRAVLAKTLGVPLFQEQAMALAIVAAGFTPGEADRLRRAMAAWKRKGNLIEQFGQRLVGGMLERGYERSFAERCFAQIKGFSEYGFPESHAASFALLVYVSCWLKRHRPAAFATALLNSQPMGFYAPAQIVRDARDHGVEVRAVDVNTSAWDCTLESGDGRRRASERTDDPATWGRGGCAMRLGMRLVKGLRREDAERVTDAVQRHGAFDSIEALHRISGASASTLRRLAAADAFRSMGLDRQRATWIIRRLRDEALPLFDSVKGGTFPGSDSPSGSDSAAGAPEPGNVPIVGSPTSAFTSERDEGRCLPPVALPRNVAQDYQAMRLSLKAHPMAFLRSMLERRGVTEAVALEDESLWPNRVLVTVAGVILVRQRPATAAGVVFVTLEDETGIANLILRPAIYQEYRRVARHSVAILAEGTVERQGRVVHVLVRSLEGLDEQLVNIATRSRDFH